MTNPVGPSAEYVLPSIPEAALLNRHRRATERANSAFSANTGSDSFNASQEKRPENTGEYIQTGWLDSPIGGFLDYWLGLKQLVKEAEQALLRQPSPISGENPLQAALINLLENPETLERITTHPELTTQAACLISKKMPLAAQTIQSREFAKATNEEQAALMLSHAGVGPGKLFQILADDPRVPETDRTIFRQLQSKGAATRTLSQTQNLIDQLYRPGKYQVIQQLGVGTIGEVYLAKHGKQPVVIKLLKDGVDAKSMAQEKALGKALIQSAFPDPKKQAYQLKRLENLYSQWEKELDFAKEAKNAKGIAKGATRYKVAQSLECGYSSETGKAVSLVQEIAPGVELKKLAEWLPLSEDQPDEYLKQIKSHLGKAPWLKDPDLWKSKLPKAFREAYNEQAFLRIQGNQTFLTHGDPHGGNVFVNFNPTTRKLETTFIDAGLALPQNSRQAASQIGLLLGSISGDSQKLSDYILSKAEIPMGTTSGALGSSLRQVLDERLFKANVNLTDCQYNQQFMDALLEDKQIILPEAETAAFKAQMQAIRTYDQISKVVGQRQNNYLRDSIPDLYEGLKKLFWAQPLTAGRELAPACLHYWREGNTAIRNTLQFLVPKPVPKKSDIEIEEIF